MSDSNSDNNSDKRKQSEKSPGSLVSGWLARGKAALSEKSSQVNRQSGRQSGQLPSSQKVDAFLQKADQTRAVAAVREKQPAGRLIFALDATASREATWDQASQLQAEMFLAVQNLDAGQHQLAVQLCYFKGYAGFYRTDWFRDSAPLLKVMGKMRCEAGITKIERVLSHIQTETRKNKVQAAVYIGDCMEENPDRLIQKAGELRLLGVPLFIFQEGAEPSAKSCFQRMADVSGGAYASFDNSSADQLRDLLKAVAIYAGGGLSALQQFSQIAHPAVARLSHQLGGKS
ncbi:VWA domain-containing protein [Pseudohongiella nitratireducens]|uniref:VWA domain-containing protein n=1 Tax=Pseudohongiella nitratireducens TaxID=1768907 RepID=UPI0030ECD2C2